MARSPRFDSAMAKINRADKHLGELKKEVEAFIQPDLYFVSVETYRKDVKWVECRYDDAKQLGLDKMIQVRQLDDDTVLVPLTTTYYSLKRTMLKQIPATTWGTIAGDILNNLRGALDNLAWELADAAAGPAPNPVPKTGPGREWRDIRFPVIVTNTVNKNSRYATRWDEAQAVNLRGVTDRRVLARIKEAQPFYRRQHPERWWLAILDELWNADKHRLVTRLYSHAGWRSINLDFHWPERMRTQEIEDNFAVSFFHKRNAGPVERDTEEIARFRIYPKRINEKILANVNVEVNAKLAFDVGFDQRSQASGSMLIWTLEGFLNRTLALLTDIQTLFP